MVFYSFMAVVVIFLSLTFLAAGTKRYIGKELGPRVLWVFFITWVAVTVMSLLAVNNGLMPLPVLVFEAYPWMMFGFAALLLWSFNRMVGFSVFRVKFPEHHKGLLVGLMNVFTVVELVMVFSYLFLLSALLNHPTYFNRYVIDTVVSSKDISRVCSRDLGCVGQYRLHITNMESYDKATIYVDELTFQHTKTGDRFLVYPSSSEYLNLMK